MTANPVTRIHVRCGQPMTASILSAGGPLAAHHRQRAWMCFACEAWEPREGWQGALPVGWNGSAWTGGAR